MKLTKGELFSLIAKTESLVNDEYAVETGTMPCTYKVKFIRFRPLMEGALQMTFTFYLEGKTPGVRVSTKFPDFEGEFWDLESYEVQGLYSRCQTKMSAIEKTAFAKIILL